MTFDISRHFLSLNLPSRVVVKAELKVASLRLMKTRSLSSGEVSASGTWGVSFLGFWNRLKEAMGSMPQRSCEDGVGGRSVRLTTRPGLNRGDPGKQMGLMTSAPVLLAGAGWEAHHLWGEKRGG